MRVRYERAERDVVFEKTTESNAAASAEMDVGLTPSSASSFYNVSRNSDAKSLRAAAYGRISVK